MSSQFHTWWWTGETGGQDILGHSLPTILNPRTLDETVKESNCKCLPRSSHRDTGIRMVMQEDVAYSWTAFHSHRFMSVITIIICESRFISKSRSYFVLYLHPYASRKARLISLGRTVKSRYRPSLLPAFTAPSRLRPQPPQSPSPSSSPPSPVPSVLLHLPFPSLPHPPLPPPPPPPHPACLLPTSSLALLLLPDYSPAFSPSPPSPPSNLSNPSNPSSYFSFSSSLVSSSSFFLLLALITGLGGAVRFLVVGTIGKEERQSRGQLWMEQCLTSLKYWPIYYTIWADPNYTWGLAIFFRSITFWRAYGLIVFPLLKLLSFFWLTYYCSIGLCFGVRV